MLGSNKWLLGGVNSHVVILDSVKVMVVKNKWILLGTIIEILTFCFSSHKLYVSLFIKI
mgnify:FL=1